MRVAMAGNVLAPAYSVLLRKGYAVERHPDMEGWCLASKNGYSFLAESPLELLGLIAMVEARGDAWQASDKEVDDFIQHLA